MTIKERIVESAESYIGTPFAHQQNIRGVGIDCVNFVSNVAIESGAIENIEFDRDYKRRADGGVMLRLLNEHLDLVEYPDVQVGDIMAFHDGTHTDIPRHVAFVVKVTPVTTYICHASERGVVRHRIDMSWVQRLHSLWRIRGIDD